MSGSIEREAQDRMDLMLIDEKIPEQLQIALAETCAEHAGTLREFEGRLLDQAHRIGLILIDARACVPTGEWGFWLQMKRTTIPGLPEHDQALKYMTLARAFPAGIPSHITSITMAVREAKLIEAKDAMTREESIVDAPPAYVPVSPPIPTDRKEGQMENTTTEPPQPPREQPKFMVWDSVEDMLEGKGEECQFGSHPDAIPIRPDRSVEERLCAELEHAREQTVAWEGAQTDALWEFGRHAHQKGDDMDAWADDCRSRFADFPAPDTLARARRWYREFPGGLPDGVRTLGLFLDLTDDD